MLSVQLVNRQHCDVCGSWTRVLATIHIGDSEHLLCSVCAYLLVELIKEVLDSPSKEELLRAQRNL